MDPRTQRVLVVLGLLVLLHAAGRALSQSPPRPGTGARPGAFFTAP